MSVSIDEDPADDESAHEDARAVLTSWLDDYVAGRCERSDMEESFLSVCRDNPEAPWDALALLDQYQRLGRIDGVLARDLKTPIEQLVFGVSKQGKNKDRKDRGDAAPPTIVSSGAQRSKHIERDEDGNTDDIDSEADASRPRSHNEIGRSPFTPPAAHGQDDEADDPEPVDDEDAHSHAPARPHSEFERERDGSTRARLRARWNEEVHQDVPREQVHRTRWRGVPARHLPSSPAVDRQSDRPAAPAAAVHKKVLRDRYELLSMLGQGGSSTVYRALDRHRANLSESARYVAVKVLNADYDSNPSALAELEREFHQAQSLSHPNIASVFDLDRDGSTYFVVMELLQGESLAQLLRRLDNRPMARKYALALIGSLGAALAHAHRRDIVHGDLKPRNVMITSMGEMRVLNFGLAHSHALQSGEIDAGRDGVSIGTPAYASAERVHGVEPDASDDVYSLACIAYELLSGRHPYGGRSAFLARAHGRRAQRIPGLTHKQWHALQRALAWDRAERKIEVVDLLAALGTADAPQELVPPELLVLPDDSHARRWRAVGLAAALVAAIALGVYLITRIPAPPQSVDTTSAVPEAPPTDGELLAGSETAAADSAAGGGGDAAEQSASPSDSAPATGTSTEGSPSGQRVEQQNPLASTSSTPSPAAARSGRIQFDKDTYVATESEGSVRLQVTRSQSTRSVLSFRWRLRANSAGAGTDFADIGPAVEQISSGARTASITVPLVKDAVPENTELFLVELEPMNEGVSLGELAHAAVIIVDDD